MQESKKNLILPKIEPDLDCEEQQLQQEEDEQQVFWSLKAVPRLFLLSVWPDLVRFHHFGNILKVIGYFISVYLVFHTILNILWHIFDAIGQYFIFVNA